MSPFVNPGAPWILGSNPAHFSMRPTAIPPRHLIDRKVLQIVLGHVCSPSLFEWHSFVPLNQRRR